MRNFLEQVRRARRDEKPYQQRVQQQLGKAEDAWWKDGLDDFIAKQESDSTLAYARYQTDFWQPATGGNRQTSNARQSSTYTNAMSKDWSRVGQQDDDHLDNQFNQPPTPQAPRPTYAQREGQQQGVNQTSQTDKLWQQDLATKKAEYNSDIQLAKSKLGFFGPAPSSSTEDEHSLISVAHTTLGVIGVASGTGQYQFVMNDRWRGLNGQWYDLSWGGNQWTGARSMAVETADFFETFAKRAFFADVVVSGYEAYLDYNNPNYTTTVKLELISKIGLDVAVGAAGTFLGPEAFVGSVGYFAVDKLIGWNNVGQAINTAYQVDKKELDQAKINMGFGGSP